jgi:hypothetical protein
MSTASVSKDGDVMMTSSSQKEGILKRNIILPKKDPPEGRTTAIVAVMRGRPKHGHHCQRSNKHYKQKLVQVLLDSGFNGTFVFVDKDKPMLLPSSKRLVPQSWNTLNGMFQNKRMAEIELNFFEYSDRKGTLRSPISLSMTRIISHRSMLHLTSRVYLRLANRPSAGCKD